MTDPTPPACARLAGELRELRARTGLSMAVLAERTPYSKSSWGRYLTGRQLAPRNAVDALCALAGEPAGRLLALWELADVEWSGRAQAAPPVPARAAGEQQDTDRTPGNRAGSGPATTREAGRRKWWALAAACAVGLAAAWVMSLSGTGADGTSVQTAHSAPPALGCRGHTCRGHSPLTEGCAASGEVKDIGPKAPYRTATGALVAVRYSPQCRAAWALLWQAHAGDVLELSDPGRRPQRVTVPDGEGTDGSVITPMLDAGDLTRLQACYEPVGGGHTDCVRLDQGRASPP